MGVRRENGPFGKGFGFSGTRWDSTIEEVEEVPVTVTGDDFTGTGGIAPDETKWRTSTPPPVLDNNQLNLIIPGGAESYKSVISNFHMDTGDFDIEVEYDLGAVANANIWITEFAIMPFSTEQIWDDQDNLNMRTFYYNGGLMSYVRYVGGVGDEQAIGSNVKTGKFRHTRVGTTFTGYYWENEAWVARGTNTQVNMAGELMVVIRASSVVGFPAFTALNDNFVVNSGTATYP